MDAYISKLFYPYEIFWKLAEVIGKQEWQESAVDELHSPGNWILCRGPKYSSRDRADYSML